eukprot:scaffold6124_cov122-Cylindrotheca_fusiformis.AAC.8
MNTPAWESSKENAAPLERGRNVAALERSAFGLQDLKKSEQSIDMFERVVRPSEAPHVTEMENDPLEHWLAYIRFYQETFPSDTHDQFLLMERCTRALIKMRQYADDDRFIGVCAKYADKTKDPMEVFKYLHQQRVGLNTALFWIAWAFVAERNNDFPFAEKIFKKGISKDAQPLQLLKIRHQQFQRRMSRHWLNNSQRSDMLDDEEDPGTRTSRGILGGVPRGRRRNTDMSASTGRQSQRSRTYGVRQPSAPSRQNTNSNSATGLAIYVEEDSLDDGYNLDHSYGRTRVIETQADRKKENTADAERWNERGGLHIERGLDRSFRSKGPPPAFPVFVDEECAARHENDERFKEKEVDHRRRDRDERTFRERGDEGMAERLARDPLRYVRDPSQLQTDTTTEKKGQQRVFEQQKAVRKSKSERSRTGFSKRLLRNSSGEEQSFEEARANQGCFTLAASEKNFNLLHVIQVDQSSQMDLDEDGSMEISTVDSEKASHFASDSAVRAHPNRMSRVPSTTEGRTLFRSENSFEGSLNQTAISTASSAMQEMDAVGAPAKKEEETINTKFAMRELSMMFSSPGFGVDDTASKTEAAKRNQSKVCDESFENMVDTMDHHQLDNSVLNVEDDNVKENDGVLNQSARGVNTPGFNNMALRELDGQPEGETFLSCRSQIGRSSSLYQLSQENPLRGRERDLITDPGFKVFEDEDAKADDTSRKTLSRGFGFYEDAQQVDSPRLTAKADFSISGDDSKVDDEPRDKSELQVHEAKPSSRRLKEPSISEGKFSIFVDSIEGHKIETSSYSSDESGVSDMNDENGNTATLSLFEGAVGMLNDSGSKQEEKSPASTETRSRRSNGDTATISLFNEVFSESAEEQNDEAQLMQVKRRDMPQQSRGFNIFVDGDLHDENPHDDCYKDNDAQNSLSERPQKRRLVEKATRATVDYASIHERDSKVALRRLQASSLVPDSRISLQRLLSNVGNSFHLPHIPVPRILRRKSVIPSKMELTIGKHSGNVCNELGRGAYGVVFLLEAIEDSDNCILAVKAQAPTSCLALECAILRRLEQRIDPREFRAYPFPRSLSFVSLADGAVFSMTAGSRSGLNLVDLVNAYTQKLGEPLPELIALHYTSRMLKHVEMLHWHGRILVRMHCDVKPDNFVLCSLDCPDNIFRHIEHSDLFLVDFGRAVDLDQFSDQNEDVRNIMFHGKACSDDMMCVAMRNGMPWSYDIDTYGILSAAHVLLFGRHIEITMESNGHWRLVRRFQSGSALSASLEATISHSIVPVISKF